MLYTNDVSPAKDLKLRHTIVGPTAVQVAADSVTLVKGLMLRAPGGSDLVPNTDVIYIGRKSVTCTGIPGSDTDGFPLLPGGVLELPVDDPAGIWAICQTAGQDLCWIGL